MATDSASHLHTAAEPSRDAVIDLLGMLSYGQLVAFDQMSRDARLAPDLRRRALLSQLAAAELTHYQRLADELAQLGVQPEQAMRPFVVALEDFHASTQPSDWLEGLVKVVVGDGIADDFHREVANFVGEKYREVVLAVLHDNRLYDYAVREVRAAIAADPSKGDALALWARRLIGEAMGQAQRVAAERESLVRLVIDGSGSLTGVVELFKRLTHAHTERLRLLGLSS